MASPSNCLAAIGALCLGFLATGCNRSAPDPPPTLASAEEPALPPVADAEPPPSEAPPGSEASLPPQLSGQAPTPGSGPRPMGAATMAPIPNPEDLSAENRRRIYGEAEPAREVTTPSAKVRTPASLRPPARHSPRPPANPAPETPAEITPPAPETAPASPPDTVPGYARLAALLAVLATALLALAAKLATSRRGAKRKASPSDSGLPAARA